MLIVRSEASYADFIQRGSDVESALHRDDGSRGFVIGYVEVLAEDDEEITQDEYDAEAQVIRDYNATLPPTPPEPESDPLEADFSPGERKALRALLPP